MQQQRSAHPLWLLNLLGLGLTLCIHLYSYFGYMPYSFSFLLALFPLLLISFLAIRLKAHPNSTEDVKHFFSWRNWSQRFQSIFVIVFINAILQLFIFLKFAGNFHIEQQGDVYYLYERAIMIREATEAEYRLFWAHSVRLLSAYLLLFFTFTVYGTYCQYQKKR